MYNDKENIMRNDLVNGLICSNVGSPIRDDIIIALNSKEMQLAMDKNPDSMNASWDLMCKSVQSRNGQGIKNCVNVDFIRINGVDKPFH